MREPISERVKRLGFPVGEYVVVGGAMEAHGIREAGDLDIVVTESLFASLIDQGWEVCECDACREEWNRGSARRMLKRPGIDILSDYSWKDAYRADTAELIKNADIIDGVPYAPLTELVKWKRAAGREKDMRDIELIEQYLAGRSPVMSGISSAKES